MKKQLWADAGLLCSVCVSESENSLQWESTAEADLLSAHYALTNKSYQNHVPKQKVLSVSMSGGGT